MLKQYLYKKTKTAPLAVFRFLFGILMAISIIRFWKLGWIESLYIQPKWFFTYYGFEFIKPLGVWTYFLFIIMFFSAISVALGYKYRLSIILFFLSFTYVELIDKTTYLNHYYFVSILSFLLIFLPANASFSWDAYKNKKKHFTYVPTWTIDAIKLLIGIVYVYAGLAKLNSDWLLQAQPLATWLPIKSNIPVIGPLLKLHWVHYFLSWSGMLYDICIPFLLLYKPTRKLAFVLVVIFHFLTHILFPSIGMFPLIMTFAVFIFFSAEFHQKIITFVEEKVLKLTIDKKSDSLFIYPSSISVFIKVLVLLFFVIQLLLPWRYLAYSGELFWREEGYRFSWRVMLVEKVGYTIFTIVNPKDKTQFEIRNEDFLTNFQIKQMSFQPDFILQYAHMLRNHYIKEGIENPEIYVKSYVTLNARLSKPFINSKVNLAKEEDSFKPKNWILPFYGTIKGL